MGSIFIFKNLLIAYICTQLYNVINQIKRFEVRFCIYFIITGYERRKYIMIESLAKLERKWYLEGYVKGFVQGFVQGFIKEYYKVEDFDWIEECTHDQLTRVFELTDKRLSYKEFKETIMSE